MSKLLEKIEAELTGKEYPSDSPVNYLATTIDINSSPIPNKVEVRVGMRFGYQAIVEPNRVENAKQEFYKFLQKEAYGEIIDHVMNLKALTAVGDKAGMMKEVEAMIETMGY